MLKFWSRTLFHWAVLRLFLLLLNRKPQCCYFQSVKAKLSVEVSQQTFLSQGSFAAVLVTVEQKATVLLLTECQSKTVGRSVAADLPLTGQFCGCSCYCWTESHCVAAFSVKAKPFQQKCWSRLFSHRAVLGLFSLLLKRKPLFCCFQSVKLKAKLCQ